MNWFQRKPPRAIRGHWKLDQPLLFWSNKEAFTIGHSFEGVLALGATGAGKSSTLAEQLAIAMLRAGYGGYVSTFKSEDRTSWQTYVKRTVRQKDFILFGPDHPWRFNFLDYELNRPGRGAGHTENIVRLFGIALEIAGGNSTPSRDGRESGSYWENTKLQLLRNMIDLLILAKGTVSIPDLYQLVISAPRSRDECVSPDWKRRSFCYKCLLEAERRIKSSRDHQTYQVVVDYFTVEFATLNEKTRSIIVSSFTSMADLLNRGIGKELLCTTTNVVPEDLESGTILFSDLPIVEFGSVGRLIQGILCYSFQTGLQRRQVIDGIRPVFFFADECQHFLTSEQQLFQTTCRSARIATIYLTQNIPNMIAALGGNSLGKAQCDSLLGNINHKVFFNNTCAATNEYASTLIGRTRQFLLNSSHSQSHPHWLDAITGMGHPPQTSAGMNEAWEYEVQPSAFTRLLTGGVLNKGEVQAIVVRSGRTFADTGRIWRLAHFQQALRNKR